MQIESIWIREFRGIEERELHFQPNKPLVLTGDNGAGKTSTLQAIQWCLTGKNPTDQPHSEGIARYEDSSRTAVAIRTPGGQIRRQLDPHKLQIEGRKAKTLTTAQSHLCTLIGGTEEDIYRALRPDTFVALKDADRAAQIYEICDLRVPPELLEAEVAKLGETAVKQFVSAHGPSYSDIDGANSSLRSERKSRKRQLKEVSNDVERIERTERKGEAPPFAEAPDAEDYNWVRKEIADCHERLGQGRQTNRQHAALTSQVQAIKSELPEVVGTEAERLQECRARYRELTKELQARPGTNELQRRIESLKDPNCYTCGQAWPDSEERAALLAKTEEELAEVSKLLDELALCSANGEALSATVSQLEKLSENEAKLTELEPVDTAATEERLAELEENFAALQSQKTDSDRYEVWVEQKRKAKEKLAYLKEIVEALELLVTLTGDAGLKQTYLRDQMRPVSEQLSGILGTWDMEARFHGTAMEIKTRHGWTPLSHLSDGERILVALAVQVWLSDKSGLRIVILDRLEALDHENQDRLFLAVSDLLETEAIDHAILAGVGLAAVDAIDLSQKEVTNV